MIKIKLPKKINEKNLNNFFQKEGLKDLISKKKYFVDGYQVTKLDYENKKKNKDKFDIRITNNPQPPELMDLYRIFQFIVLNNRTTVLEFGCGFSSLVISKALKKVKKKNKNKKPFPRCVHPYKHFIVDNEKKYVNIVKKRLKKYSLLKNVNFSISEVRMTTFNENFASEYVSLPRVNPDFIYLDAPNPFTVKKKINNFSVSALDMMPMSCDILKFENFLIPGTIILVDGRTLNARFLKNNFKRNWREYHNEKYDQTIFVLDEKPIGIYNKLQLKFYKLNN